MRRVAERRIRAAIELGAFDNLPGEGRPIADLDQPYDPDWWIKKWLERARTETPASARDARLGKVAAVEERLTPNELELFRTLKLRYEDPGAGSFEDKTCLEVILRNIKVRKGFGLEPEQTTSRVIELGKKDEADGA